MSQETVAIGEPGVAARVQAVLAAGECVVLPTDTVYGIAVSAGDRAAIARLQAAKGRSDAFPPPVLVGDPGVAWELAPAAPAAARRLAEAFWPGPLTLILATTAQDVSLSGTTGTVGIRVPGHPGLRELLRATGPLAVSSANRHDQPPATTVEEAMADLGASVALYVDGGPTPGPVPSSVVDCSGAGTIVNRAGLISRAAILQAAGAGDA